MGTLWAPDYWDVHAFVHSARSFVRWRVEFYRI